MTGPWGCCAQPCGGCTKACALACGMLWRAACSPFVPGQLLEPEHKNASNMCHIRFTLWLLIHDTETSLCMHSITGRVVADQGFKG